jgi:hypothetical protein
MILDSQLSLSRAQSIAAAAGDVVSTDIYDTGAAADAGIGEELYLHIATGTAVTSGGSATVQFVLQTSPVENFGSGVVEFPLTAARALAALTANTVQYRGRLPIGLLRYVRLVYRIATATTTAGTANAFLVHGVQANAPIATTVPGVK